MTNAPGHGPWIICDLCDGDGYADDPEAPCPACGGDGGRYDDEALNPPPADPDSKSSSREG